MARNGTVTFHVFEVRREFPSFRGGCSSRCCYRRANRCLFGGGLAGAALGASAYEREHEHWSANTFFIPTQYWGNRWFRHVRCDGHQPRPCSFLRRLNRFHQQTGRGLQTRHILNSSAALLAYEEAPGLASPNSSRQRSYSRLCNVTPASIHLGADRSTAPRRPAVAIYSHARSTLELNSSHADLIVSGAPYLGKDAFYALNRVGDLCG